MKTKKIIAFALSCAMVLSTFPASVLADGDNVLKPGVTEATKPTLKAVYMREKKSASEYDAASDGCLYEEASLPRDGLKVGDTFVICVEADNFDNFVGNAKGVYSVGTGIAYDSRYIEVAERFTSDSTPVNSDDDFADALNERMLDYSGGSANFNSTYFYNNGKRNLYEIASAAMTKSDDSNYNTGLSTDNSNIKIVQFGVQYKSLTAKASEFKNKENLMYVYFKVKALPPAGSPGVSITLGQDTGIQLGIPGTAEFEDYTYHATTELEKYLNIDTTSLQLFPAGAARKTGISIKSGTMASTQFVGDVFKPGVNLQFDYDDSSHADLDTSDTVTYKYGAAGITAADDSGLTAIPATLKTEVDGKHIYAIVGNFICDLGELTVNEIKTTNITVSGAPTTAYDGTAIDFKNLVATIEKNNGTSVSDLKFTDYENVSNDLAIYKSNATGDVLDKVTAADKYGNGNNYFVVATTDKTIKSATFNVVSDYDLITLSTSTNNKIKSSYNDGDAFDPSGLVIGAKKASESAATDVKYADFNTKLGSNKWLVVVAVDDTAAKSATASTTTVTKEMIDNKNKIFVVYTNQKGEKQALQVATLGAKKIKSATISGGKTDYTYGDKLKTDDLELNVTYDDNSTGKISYADLAAAGITVKIGETLVDANTVITPAMKGKTVDFIYDGKTLTSSAKITVAAKTVYYTVSDATITKVYDGGLTIPADQTLPTISIKDSATAFVGTDSYTVTGTFAYTDKNVGTDKKIKLTTTLPETNGKYTFAPDTDKINADGTLKTAATITAKALTLNAGVITGLSTKADPNATADVTKDGSLVLTKDNSNLVDGDNVTVPYTYTFTANDVKTAGNDKDVTIALKDLTGADKDNYTFDKTQVTTAKGNVTQEAFSDIEISGPTKVTYTYPELTPDLSDLVVNALYGTGTSAIKVPVTNYTLTKKDGTTFKPAEPLPYGDTEVTITYKGKTKTITLTAKKKPIKLSDIIFKPESKSYDGTTTATGTATVKEGVTVAGDTVNISAKWEFDGKDVGTNTIKVSDIKADNENYEIVGEDNLPVSSTTINHSTAVIKPATPENVTAKADKKTNNIVLSGTTADFEYSTDNGATWVKAAAGTTTIENAVRNKEYTILVRTAATTSAPASDAATVKATTYKYLVNIYKNGAAAGSEPEYKVYTNDEEINAVKDDTTFGKFNSNVLQYTPSRFSAYFTDSACTTSADVANLPKDSNDNINLYYTAKKSSGGGGGGGRSVSIKLDKDTVSGVVGDKIKVTATVTGSTAKPTWTSSNEDVATVDENGNITLVGKGTATVKVKVNGVVKNIPVTVKEATATPTPVPTVKPTEAPVINTEYTKPYASGYDDGSFLPNNNITRGELAAMIARLSYGDDLPDGMYQASFPDVDSDAWFNKYIGYLEDKDVLSGYEDGTFRPMDTITRGEISAVIARAQRYDLISYNGIFTDVTENDWAKDYIETLADKNIVSGYEDGTFGPYSPLTRAEAVAIINRVLVESTPIVTFTPNDIAGHWAEADILLAVNERMVGANAVVPTVKPEETAAPEETVAPETTVTPEETVAPEKTTAPEATPAA